ncbi:MAG TPA: L-serine ammonia-lyase [Gammaproteobacteria bacterium]
MRLSVFDLFRVGIGPSSSHTVGPMVAAGRFVRELEAAGVLPAVERVGVTLYGSLAATGPGHGTTRAVLLGLEGEQPAELDPGQVAPRLAAIAASGRLQLLGRHAVPFQRPRDLELRPDTQLPEHTNGMRCAAFAADGSELLARDYYSIGGGFVRGAGEVAPPALAGPALPYPFASAEELLGHCRAHDLPVSGVMRANELAQRTAGELDQGLQRLWQVMRDCVRRGCGSSGELPGGLHLRRRAPALRARLDAAAGDDPLRVLDWVELYALAVNEENAAGGRVVTAPTNGAAGIVPAVLHYYRDHCPGADDAGVARFLLVAAAIGMLYKLNASLSGAEVGCQGEVGVACSMASGALAEVLGGTPEQVENAAEIGMEHNLGLTCDPVAGLVQVPCIERNAMAAVKAIAAARMALNGDGSHFVSLDRVIRTMRDTGRDMQDKYKETARGGLAVSAIDIPVSVVDC